MLFDLSFILLKKNFENSFDGLSKSFLKNISKEHNLSSLNKIFSRYISYYNRKEFVFSLVLKMKFINHN